MVNQTIIKTFRKVEINISLLDAIKQLPYVKFLKELCTTKCKFKGNKKVSGLGGRNMPTIF